MSLLNTALFIASHHNQFGTHAKMISYVRSAHRTTTTTRALRRRRVRRTSTAQGYSHASKPSEDHSRLWGEGSFQMSHRLLERPRDKGLIRISFIFLHSCHDHRGQCVATGCHHELPARACGRYILLRRSVGTKRCSSPLKITVFSPAGSTPVRPAGQDSERQGCRCVCVCERWVASREREREFSLRQDFNRTKHKEHARR
jgi:hypothetical protein